MAFRFNVYTFVALYYLLEWLFVDCEIYNAFIYESIIGGNAQKVHT